jgi:hypothetical protein
MFVAIEKEVGAWRSGDDGGLTGSGDDEHRRMGRAGPPAGDGSDGLQLGRVGPRGWQQSVVG